MPIQKADLKLPRPSLEFGKNARSLISRSFHLISRCHPRASFESRDVWIDSSSSRLSRFRSYFSVVPFEVLRSLVWGTGRSFLSAAYASHTKQSPSHTPSAKVSEINRKDVAEWGSEGTRLRKLAPGPSRDWRSRCEKTISHGSGRFTGWSLWSGVVRTGITLRKIFLTLEASVEIRTNNLFCAESFSAADRVLQESLGAVRAGRCAVDLNRSDNSCPFACEASLFVSTYGCLYIC